MGEREEFFRSVLKDIARFSIRFSSIQTTKYNFFSSKYTTLSLSFILFNVQSGSLHNRHMTSRNKQ
jgi:hypothetical protein